MNSRNPPLRYLRTSEAERFLSLSPRTLETHRSMELAHAIESWEAAWCIPFRTYSNGQNETSRSARLDRTLDNI